MANPSRGAPIDDNDSVYPVSFVPGTAGPGAAAYLDDPGVQRLVEFFQAKGLAALKAEDRAETWYADWIAYQGRHGLYASVLAPKDGSSRGGHLDLLKLARFWEAAAYFSPAHAYSLHVSFLGLYPILRNGNDVLRRDALEKLEAGGIFGFGISERSHGADLLSTEFTVADAAPGRLVASGSKYYIGNANAAAMITVLGKRVDERGGGGGGGATVGSRRAPFVLFALRPTEPGVARSIRKIRTFGIRAAYVAAFDVDGHEFPETDVICAGRDAWETVLATVTLGKLFLCFGSIGICEHAFAEAAAHTRSRILYGKPVATLPHIRTAMAHAYARLTAMKLFAFRTLDYLHAARADDRRYLLYAAVQKASVSSEAVDVIAMLSECIGARGFESETYFETALRDAPLVPLLEGSTHINYQVVALFLGRYFAGKRASKPLPDNPPSLRALGRAVGENPYLMKLRTGDERAVRFRHFLEPYRPLRKVRNVRIFVRQLRAFRRFAVVAAREASLRDVELNIALGKCLSVVAYAQLCAEHCALAGLPPELVSLIFHQSIEALSVQAWQLASSPRTDPRARAQLASVPAVPQTEQWEIDFLADRTG